MVSSRFRIVDNPQIYRLAEKPVTPSTDYFFYGTKIRGMLCIISRSTLYVRLWFFASWWLSFCAQTWSVTTRRRALSETMLRQSDLCVHISPSARNADLVTVTFFASPSWRQFFAHAPFFTASPVPSFEYKKVSTGWASDFDRMSIWNRRISKSMPQ
jgi:hypothetical protein